MFKYDKTSSNDHRTYGSSSLTVYGNVAQILLFSIIAATSIVTSLAEFLLWKTQSSPNPTNNTVTCVDRAQSMVLLSLDGRDSLAQAR
eukprot:scaffold91291_cov19-Prasinocladus_malaysianus.AAC.1